MSFSYCSSSFIREVSSQQPAQPFPHVSQCPAVTMQPIHGFPAVLSYRCFSLTCNVPSSLLQVFKVFLNTLNEPHLPKMNIAPLYMEENPYGNPVLMKTPSSGGSFLIMHLIINSWVHATVPQQEDILPHTTHRRMAILIFLLQTLHLHTFILFPVLLL